MFLRKHALTRVALSVFLLIGTMGYGAQKQKEAAGKGPVTVASKIDTESALFKEYGTA